MVVYLPIAVFRDWICSRLDMNSFKNLCNGSLFAKSSTGLDIPLRINEVCPSSESDTESGLNTEMYLSENEDGWLIITKMEDEMCLLEKNRELSTWEIAKCSLLLAPIWFLTEVRVLNLLFLWMLWHLWSSSMRNLG